jgi:hypothetical protein
MNHLMISLDMDLHRCLRLLVDSHARDNEQNANKRNLVVGARVWLAVGLMVTAHSMLYELR